MQRHVVKSTWLAVETVQFLPGLEIPEAGRLVVTGGEAEFTRPLAVRLGYRNAELCVPFCACNRISPSTRRYQTTFPSQPVARKLCPRVPQQWRWPRDGVDTAALRPLELSLRPQTDIREHVGVLASFMPDRLWLSSLTL